MKTIAPNGNQRFLDLFGFHECSKFIPGKIIEIKKGPHTRLYENEWWMIKPDVWNQNRNRHYIE